MNFLVGLLLLFMSEEECYWVFHIIANHLLPHYYTMDGVLVDSYGKIARLTHPKLRFHSIYEASG